MNEELKKKLKKKLKDPIFLTKMAKQFKLKCDIKDNDINRLKNIFENDEIFSETIKKLIKKHNDNYFKKCYNKGCEPYPNQVLNLIIDYATENGKNVNPNMKSYFPIDTIFYRNYYFEFMYGQGTMITIYDSNKLALITF